MKSLCNGTVTGFPGPSAWALPPAADRRLRALMRKTVLSMGGPLGNPLMRIITAGGKGLRPALTITTAAIGGCEAEDAPVLAAAAAIEFLHVASLVHDDLIDQAPIRRGVATLSAREGPSAAIVGGDLLIAAACTLAGEVSREAGGIMAETLAQLCRGEAIQDELRYRPFTSVESLTEVMRLKAGSLLRAACLLGAHCWNADAQAQSAVADFGMDLGVCLQLTDDLLDVVSSPVLAAKPVGTDFSAGTPTLPAVLAIRENAELGQLLRPGLDPASRQRAISLLQSSAGPLAATEAAARDYATRAARRLDAADLGPAARELARWPEAYLNGQLASRVDDEHRWLFSQLAGATP